MFDTNDKTPKQYFQDLLDSAYAWKTDSYVREELKDSIRDAADRQDEIVMLAHQEADTHVIYTHVIMNLAAAYVTGSYPALRGFDESVAMEDVGGFTEYAESIGVAIAHYVFEQSYLEFLDDVEDELEEDEESDLDDDDEE